MKYTFTFNNWEDFDKELEKMIHKTETFDILEALDDLESEVEQDPEYTLANQMLSQILT